MQETDGQIKFTGEFFVPGKSGKRIEADHIERYRFTSLFSSGKSVLDIACGVGYSGPLFIEAGAVSYLGVDINQKLIAYAKRSYGSNLVKYALGDICSFSVGQEYDLIACYETIEHVENYEMAIKNLYQLLKPGGFLFISSPNRLVTSPNSETMRDKPVNEFHHQEFTPSELISLLNGNGFVAKSENLYGQRQREKIYRNRYIKNVVYTLFGNPDLDTSPEVTPVIEKIPRYFIIKAQKKSNSEP